MLGREQECRDSLLSIWSGITHHLRNDRAAGTRQSGSGTDSDGSFHVLSPTRRLADPQVGGHLGPCHSGLSAPSQFLLSSAGL
jgi:hypothetical protein